MATKNGKEILTPLRVTALLKQHNMLRDARESVSEHGAETTGAEGNPRNSEERVALTA